MSDCQENCTCSERKARKLLQLHGLKDVAEKVAVVKSLAVLIESAIGRCPQSCGESNWPECGCPTPGIKELVLKRSEIATRRQGRGSKGLSMLEMMVAKGATRPGQD